MTGFGRFEESTVGSLSANLAELIQAMRQDGRALIALCEFSDHRYVQFWLQPDGRLIGEVISNLNVGTSIALGPRAEKVLRELGFHEPALGPKPNWWFPASDSPDVSRLIKMMNVAIYDVLEESAGNAVSVKTWMADAQPGETLDDAHANHRAYTSAGPQEEPGHGCAAEFRRTSNDEGVDNTS